MSHDYLGDANDDEDDTQRSAPETWETVYKLNKYFTDRIYLVAQQVLQV